MNIFTIQLHNIEKQFKNAQGPQTLFSQLSINFTQKKSYLITGPSGAGKSTLLAIIAGIEKPTFGTVLFDGSDIHNTPKALIRKFRQKSIGIVFQKPYLFQELSVIENIILPAIIAATDNQKTMYDRAEQLLSTFGLLNKKTAAPAVLSGGEQQRVALARALCTNPDFLLADEPTAFLDRKTADQILDCIFSYVRDRSIGLIMTSHDESVTSRADEVFILSESKFIKK